MKSKLLMVLFALMILVGLFQGEAGRVFRHAMLICFSCLGIRQNGQI